MALGMLSIGFIVFGALALMAALAQDSGTGMTIALVLGIMVMGFLVVQMLPDLGIIIGANHSDYSPQQPEPHVQPGQQQEWEERTVSIISG